MSVFIKLADYIDEIYGSGINKHDEESAFVNIFQALLSENEAEVALSLNNSLETVCQISNRTGVSEEYLAQCLETLSYKGIIYEYIENNVRFYRLMPFVPGILESLIKISTNSMIAEYLQKYADEMEHYKQEYTQSVIPVNCKINVQVQNASLREIEIYLENTDKYAVMDCICRTIQEARGKACGHPIHDMCLIIGDYADFYVRIGNAKFISRQEVYDILERAEEQGLYHELYPVEKNKSTFICNCCTCGCNSEKCFQCGWCVIFCENHAIEFGEKGALC